MKKYLSCIIFWGAFWGLTEATLGYVLHSLSLGIGWVLWFPLAFYFISSVYRRTNSLSSVIFTSFLAAAVKTIDFIMPTSPDKIINPAVSIILEGFAVFVLFRLVSGRSGRQDAHRPGYLRILSVSAGWRLLYVAYMLLMPASYAAISPLRSASALLNFLLVGSLANSLIIYVFMRVSELAGKKTERSAGQAAEQGTERIGVVRNIGRPAEQRAERSAGQAAEQGTEPSVGQAAEQGTERIGAVRNIGRPVVSIVKRLKVNIALNSVLEIAISCLMLAAALLAQWAL